MKRLLPCQPRRFGFPAAAGLVALLSLLAAAPAQAQLDGLLRQAIGGRGGAEVDRLTRSAQPLRRDLDRAADAATCDKMTAWLSRIDDIPPEVLARRFGGAARGSVETQATAQIPYESWLLEDGRFVPAFGKPYDAIGPDEAASLQKLRCASPRNAAGQAITDNMFFYRVFQPAFQPRYAQGVRQIRTARQEADAALADLGSLSADEAGLRRLTEMRQNLPRWSAFMTPDRRASFEGAFAAADRRVAQPVQFAAARQSVAQARGYEGLQSLVALHVEMERSKSASRSGAANPAIAELRSKEAEIARQIVADEKARIDALGTGPSGLERGVQWHKEYQARYERLAATATDLKELPAYFEQRRSGVLEAAQGELSGRMSRARSGAEVDEMIARYLPLESDRRSLAGTALLTRASESRDELYKRSVLGNQAAAEPAARAEAARPDTRRTVAKADDTAPARRSADSETSGSGEPGASEMYDILKNRFDQVAASIRERDASCQRGLGNDVGKAILCLSNGTLKGAGAGEPMKITRFEKLGCARASGKAGWMCDYLIATTGAMYDNLGALGVEAKRPGAAQARFLRSSGGWIAFFDEK